MLVVVCQTERRSVTSDKLMDGSEEKISLQGAYARTFFA